MSNSLKSLNRFISDKEVYDKQSRNYNIISAQPKEFDDTIKVFPKYRLENSDSNYQRKIQLERDMTQRVLNHKLNVGQHGIRQQPNPEAARPQEGPKRGKYLNNVDEVRDII